MSRRPSFFIAASIVAVVGCSYRAEVEYPARRVVLAETGCPDAATIAVEENADSAELDVSHLMPRGSLCWYRLEDQTNDGPPAFCRYARNAQPLDEVRAERREKLPARSELVDPVRDMVACTDAGPVLLVVAKDAVCADLEGTHGDDADDRSPIDGDDVVVRELVAVDHRSALVKCEYEVSDERTRRPFACNRSGGALGN